MFPALLLLIKEPLPLWVIVPPFIIKLEFAPAPEREKTFPVAAFAVIVPPFIVKVEFP